MIYDHLGNRKYLTLTERKTFLEAAKLAEPEVHTFCIALAYLGARLSEILALTPRNIDADAGYILIETLKRRRRGVFRAVPASTDLFDLLEKVHRLSSARRDPEQVNERLWKWSRTTAWKRVKEIMRRADVATSVAMPKALRHAFGVQTTTGARIPLNMVKKWMGHSRIETTAIYADAVGVEEKNLAASIWPSE